MSELARFHIVRDQGGCFYIADDWDYVAGPFNSQDEAERELNAWWDAENDENQQLRWETEGGR